MSLPFPLRLAEALGDVIFRGPYNLNLIAERRYRSTPGGGDDILHCFWQKKGGQAWHALSMRAETEPGLAFMEDPINPAGAAAFVGGQYRGSHRRGLHRGRPALVQVGAVRVYRDNDRDKTYNYDAPTQTGHFACNIHSVRKWGDLAGCIGVDQSDMNELLAIYDLQTKHYGRDVGVSLTVLDIPELIAEQDPALFSV